MIVRREGVECFCFREFLRMRVGLGRWKWRGKSERKKMIFRSVLVGLEMRFK